MQTALLKFLTTTAGAGIISPNRRRIMNKGGMLSNRTALLQPISMNLLHRRWDRTLKNFNFLLIQLLELLFASLAAEE